MILLIEDNPDDVKLAQRALRQLKVNCELVVARDGVEALEFLFAKGSYSQRNTAEQPVLALLDVNLPRVDGLEVLRQIREHDATRLLPVVMFTTSAEERDIQESYRLGANSYIRKPVEYEKFSKVLSCLATYWLAYNLTTHS